MKKGDRHSLRKQAENLGWISVQSGEEPKPGQIVWAKSSIGLPIRCIYRKQKDSQGLEFGEFVKAGGIEVLAAMFWKPLNTKLTTKNND